MRTVTAVRPGYRFNIKGTPRRMILSNDRPTQIGAARSRKGIRNGGFHMDENMEALLYEPWKNGACLGYAIKAMEFLDYPPEDIQEVVMEMRYLFDCNTLDEADRHYYNSSY